MLQKTNWKKRKKAYEKAHDIRKFEIGLFWQRATYYWVLFYTGIIFFRCIKSKNIDFKYFESLRWEVGIVLLLGVFALSLCIFSSAKGNDHKKEKQNSHWINRDELIKK